jgi:hypothetical protein
MPSKWRNKGRKIVYCKIQQRKKKILRSNKKLTALPTA